MEYYTGLLFLTTNRIGHFDQAFASRIHLTLPYPQLDLDSTLAIFTLSLQLIQSRFKMRDLNFTIDWDDVIRFARAYWTNNEFGRWNGRQIRNNCQTALALAEYEAQSGNHQAVVRLEAKHFETVSRPHLRLNSYLTGAKDTEVEGPVRALGSRALGRETAGGKELLPHI